MGSLFAVPIVLFPLLLIVYIFFFRPFQIIGDSMKPNYRMSQYYMSSLFDKQYSRGDVIVYSKGDKDFIKRILGLPGETVMMKNGNLYINGSKIDESSYIPSDVKTYTGSFIGESKQVIVPEGQYFVLGDNRPFSSDSREYGFIEKKDIIGKILFCYWNCRI